MTEREIREQPEDAEQTELAPEVDKALRSLVEVGRMWASHGLSIGRSALETSARTLAITADTLADLADRFDPSSKEK